MKCECLFCQAPATARLTVPKHKPRTFLCEQHLEDQMKWAEPYRGLLGDVVVEPLVN